MCPAWGCLRLGKRGWEEALVNLLNISLRGSFPPPPPFTHHTASALAGWSLREGRGWRTESLLLAWFYWYWFLSRVAEEKYWPFLSWARFCVSDRILFLGISHLSLHDWPLWSSPSPFLSAPNNFLGGALSLWAYLLDRVSFKLTHVWPFSSVPTSLLVLEFLKILKVQDVLNVTSSFLCHAKLL